MGTATFIQARLLRRTPAMSGGAVGSAALDIGLITTSAVYGFRHGIDWDHLAALGDIGATEPRRARALRLSSLYALGHAAVVFVLGAAAIALAAKLPAAVDGAMERVVGATLLLLGGYAVIGLARHGSEFRLRSRWMVLADVVSRVSRRRRGDIVVVDHDHVHGHGGHGDHGHAHGHVEVAATAMIGAAATAQERATERHSHVHRHVATLPDDPFGAYGPRTCFAVGMLHGLGAETPSQVLVFAAAAGATTTAAGITVLTAFIAGLLAANTVVAVLTSSGLLGGARHPRIYVVVTAVVATFSIVIGVLFVAGGAALLPPILGR